MQDRPNRLSRDEFTLGIQWEHSVPSRIWYAENIGKSIQEDSEEDLSDMEDTDMLDDWIVNTKYIFCGFSRTDKNTTVR